MESPQPYHPPDINEVKLRIFGGDPKSSDAYYQTSFSSPSESKNTSGKSPEEFQQGLPRDVKVPGGMVALLEDQNKNRLKSATTMASAYPLLTPSNNESCNGKSKSGHSAQSCGVASSVSNHVEIDVDMTLPQSTAVMQKDDALVNSSGSNEIICNGQKTNNSSSVVNHVSRSSAQSSITLSHHHQNHQDQRAHEQHEVQEHQPSQQQQQASPKFPPSCEKDLEILKNVRKVYVQLTDDNTPCYYKVSDESQECLFETVLGDTNGSIWSRYFKQQQKVILVHDRNQRGVLKLEFGRSRTISCCQTLRFAAMTASFKLKPEEPLCIIFKDKECCVSCCCCPEATYETVPQLDSILPFSVFTKGRWKNRAELMVKHNDGSILGFIDKEQNSYSLTMGENLKPAMKACLIGFLIAMDVMDRQDAGKLSCYLRPTTILLISLLLMLCITIGGYLLHHFSSMFLSFKEDSILCGTFDEAGSRRTATVPHFNNDRTSDSTTSSGGTGVLSSAVDAVLNASSTTEFQFGSPSLSGTGIGATTGGGNNSSSWPVV
ncbi:unnamed protein product [Orchesella dallaii]|uniref:Phospholipid scramblase n=1 Tax=Orchesella dallaii TaxID=48710 RepID=A0ABP1RDG9_9HEXA